MNQKENTVYILFGGNLDNVAHSFIEAKNKIEISIGSIFNESSLYRSPAWGFTSINDFLNQVIGIKTAHPALAVLKKLLIIETELGRVRDPNKSGFESRLIDLDILYFNHENIETPELTIPHYAISKRRFTLLPLVEIIPNYIHPILNKTNSRLLELTDDQSTVERI